MIFYIIILFTIFIGYVDNHSANLMIIILYRSRNLDSTKYSLF